jgi:hypothetical protein
MKMANVYPELRSSILNVFEQHSSAVNADLQQRATEYKALLHLPDQNLVVGAN